MQKITPNLWFDDQAEEAAHFYTSLFKDSRVGQVTRYDKATAEASGRPEGSAMTVDFRLAGQDFVALNGGPHFKFTPAISFLVTCSAEDEIDRLWRDLSQGGRTLMPLDAYPFSDKYGWLEDRYGVSWQLILANGEVEQKLVPSLMFVGNVCGKAEAAIALYTSVFPDAKLRQIMRYGADQAPDREETVMFADFELAGQLFAAMDSARAHDFTFTEAVSFIVNCETQEEVDRFWHALSAVPEAEQCGWLKDWFGVSWQIVPTVLPKLLSDPDQEKAQRVMQAMLQMKKLDIAALERAHTQG
jgi:predicted 3-demethylubiquinone-9 3-methyltransferase (glyoxalase superfamily)